MKGISLPVNLMVVVIVALICLVALILYLYLFPQSTKCDMYYPTACIKLKNEGCERLLSSIYVSSCSLLDVCKAIGLVDSEDRCLENEFKKSCGC